jgi:hypothetical protein
MLNLKRYYGSHECHILTECISYISNGSTIFYIIHKDDKYQRFWFFFYFHMQYVAKSG